jgi:hypothetical protein
MISAAARAPVRRFRGDCLNSGNVGAPIPANHRWSKSGMHRAPVHAMVGLFS